MTTSHSGGREAVSSAERHRARTSHRSRLHMTRLATTLGGSPDPPSGTTDCRSADRSVGRDGFMPIVSVTKSAITDAVCQRRTPLDPWRTLPDRTRPGIQAGVAKVVGQERAPKNQMPHFHGTIPAEVVPSSEFLSGSARSQCHLSERRRGVHLASLRRPPLPLGQAEGAATPRW